MKKEKQRFSIYAVPSDKALILDEREKKKKKNVTDMSSLAQEFIKNNLNGSEQPKILTKRKNK